MSRAATVAKTVVSSDVAVKIIVESVYFGTTTVTKTAIVDSDVT